MSETIHQQQDFFDVVRVTEDGITQIVTVDKVGEEYNPNTAKDFFNNVALDENGNIKTFI